MANEFIIRKGYKSFSDSQITGSLSVSNAVTASFFTGSFRGDGSELTGIDGFPFTGSAAISGSLTVVGPVNAITFTGDGSQLTGIEGFPFTGSARITGSLVVVGPVTATSFIGSLQGTATTASYVLNAVSSSFATTASYVNIANVDGFTAYSSSVNTAIGSVLNATTPLTATVNTTNTPFTITSQSIVIVDSTNGNVTVNLPNLNTVVGTPNQKPIVVYKNDYSQNVIFVSPSGSQLINGASQDVIVSIQLAVIYNPTSAGWVTEGTSAQSLAELELFFVPRTETGSLSVATASYVQYTNVVNKPTLVSGSSQISFTGITNKPTLVSGSSQISFSGITNKPTLVSGSSQVTYSGLTGIPSGIVSSSVQVKEYNVFATTGSNQFNGNQSITGSLTVSGQVVAQTLNVQQVTSSIVYSSGSNIFGNNSGNNHRFTGSLGVTGSLIVAGAGSFSSTVAAGGNITVTANSAAVRVTESGGADVRMVAGGSSGFFGTYSNHPLQFLTDSVTKLTLSATGNLGLGVTPSAWNSAYRAIQFGTTGAIFGESGDAANYFTTNTFVDAVGFKYITSDFALGYFQENGVHSWRTAPSGTAGNAISFTQAMTLDASGRLGIGSTSPGSILHLEQSVDGNMPIKFRNSFGATSNTNSTVDILSELVSSANAGQIGSRIRTGKDGDYSSGATRDAYLSFATAENDSLYERMRITSGGNVGIGTATPTDLLTLYRNASQDNILSLYQGTNGYASAFKLIGNNDDGARYNSIGSYTNGGTVHWLIGGGAIANTMVFYTNNNTERMRITSDGNVLIGTTSNIASSKLRVNGNIQIEGFQKMYTYGIIVQPNTTGTVTISSPTGTNMQGSMQVIAGGYGNSLSGNVTGLWMVGGLLFFNNASTSTITQIVNSVTADGSMSFQRSSDQYTVSLANTSSTQTKSFYVSVIINGD